MSTFEDPSIPSPFDDPMKMFELPVPPAFPPMLMVVKMFDKPAEFDVPIKILLDTLELDKAADSPITTVLQMTFPTLPAWNPMNSELEDPDRAAADEMPMAVLLDALQFATTAGALPVLLPMYTLLLMSPA
jgi:hypothetical protein